MNYQEVLAYMYSSLPMFHRVGEVALKPGLDNIISLCEMIGNPHKKFKSIHIAGTNGKGSSSHMLSAIFQRAGYKTGLYTSPHLKEFTERIKINGEDISSDYVCEFVNSYQTNFEAIKPSFFEMTVAMAFKYFEVENVDIAIIEVGLGGRLDSTNIILPEACLITNISMDHQAILGNTLPQIASEKAGIIKENIPVVVSETQEEIVSVFQDFATKNNSFIQFADQVYSCSEHFYSQSKLVIDIISKSQVLYKNLELDLVGNYQLKNVIGVIGLSRLMNSKGWNISDEAIRKGLKDTIKLTNFKGRWQTLSEDPLIIADVAHNESGIKALVAQIQSMKYDGLFWVLGLVKDKDIDTILKLLPKDAQYVYCQAKIPRALDASELYQKATQFSLSGVVVHDVCQALAYAKEKANKNSLIIVGGSTFVVAEVI
ncbi:MAG: bifunctional folylpolyglutamate synthase/dihydrofolate synthase [Cytophagales bacterium]|nr:MAG: bifunctional folylpolyglutamate synthase/dihydrofolate synthase [Cytophagales bacterium]